MMYKGIVFFPDGRTEEFTGTALECACWADRAVRDEYARKAIADILGIELPDNGGNIRITIQEEEDERKTESEVGR